VSDHGFDVVDLHYAFRRQTNNRAADGVHWNGVMHRAVTNSLLWHICDAWHVELPASNSLSYLPPLNEPPSLLHLNFSDSTLRRGGRHSYNNDYGPRQHNQNSDVDFTADNDYDQAHNDYVNFGCYPQQYPNTRSHSSRFGRDLTNRGRPYRRVITKRARGRVQNSRQRPY